jgi:hypothetical protein
MIREIRMVVRAMFDSLIGRIRTHVPGQVVAYDAERNAVTVQPVIMVTRTEDPASADPRPLPQIEDIPVRQYGSGKLIITVPPAVGSYGTIHVVDREFHRWMEAGGVVAPGSARKFDLSDAVFEPGLYPNKADGDNGLIESGIQTDRISIRTRSGLTEISTLADESIYLNVNDGAASITADKDGGIQVSAEGDVSVTSGGDVTVTADGKITTDGSETVLQAGSDWLVQYTALKSAFDTLKNDFNNFINVTYNLHMHPTAALGAASVPTVVGTPTTADMSAAKTAKVRAP